VLGIKRRKKLKRICPLGIELGWKRVRARDEEEMQGGPRKRWRVLFHFLLIWLKTEESIFLPQESWKRKPLFHCLVLKIMFMPWSNH